jgi:hypothetical protein
MNNLSQDPDRTPMCHPSGVYPLWLVRIPTARAVGYDLPSLRDFPGMPIS